ncbi:MAG: hypothetical protein R6V17_05160, partial [Halanaerobacter sp.]
MKKKVLLIIFLLIICWAEGVNAANRVVLLIVDGVNWQEWQRVDTPHFRSLAEQGAAALMNARTADDLEPVDTYLTIGSGKRACGSAIGRLNFNFGEEWQDEKAENIYQRRVGVLEDETAVVAPNLAQLRRDNQRSPYQAKVGNLGTILARNNLKIAVLGNADTANSYRRQVALLGINKYGIIKQGDIGRQSNQLVSQYPSQYFTNISYMGHKLKEYLLTNDLVIVESGSTSRIEAIKDNLMPQKFNESKEKAIKRADSLIGEIKSELDFERDHLILLAPTPAKEYMQQGYKLSWVLIRGPGVKSGLLSSGTTKQLGLVTNLDILATIYNYLVKDPKLNFTGQKITATSSVHAVDYLNRLNEEIRTIFSWRSLVVKLFIALQIFMILLIACSLIYKDRITIKKEFLFYPILVINWLPVFFILSKFFTAYSLALTLLIWIGGSLGLTWFSYRVFAKDQFSILILPNLLTASLLIIDLWRGGDLLKVSILSYSPVIGARYYGIGNEYMGLLIGITIVLLTLFFELKDEVNNKLLITISALLIITIAAPSLGANFGGLLAAVLTTLLSYVYLNELKFNLKTFFKVSLTGLIVILSLLIFDMSTGARSHFARLFLRLQEGGWGTLLMIIKRKLAINLRLLEWTIWSKVLLTFVLILFLLFKHPQGLISKLVDKYHYFSAGFKALLWGSLAAGIINDSGVVVVATLLMIPVFTLLYLVLLEIYFPKEGNNC